MLRETSNDHLVLSWTTFMKCQQPGKLAEGQMMGHTVQKHSAKDS